MSRELQHLPDEQKSHGNEWLWLVLAVAYMFSPIDIVPDIPVVGWVDDATALGVAGLNLLQGYLGQQAAGLASVVKMFKWLLIIFGSIAILLVLLLGTLIVSFFTK